MVHASRLASEAEAYSSPTTPPASTAAVAHVDTRSPHARCYSYTGRVESEKRRLAQLLADLARIDARLDQIKEKPNWMEVEIREEKQVHLNPSPLQTPTPLMFCFF